MMPISIFFSYLLSSRSTYLLVEFQRLDERCVRIRRDGLDLELRFFINFFRVSLSFLFFVFRHVRKHPAHNEEVTEPQPHLENVHRHALAPWGRIHNQSEGGGPGPRPSAHLPPPAFLLLLGLLE